MLAAAGDAGSSDCYDPPENTNTALSVDDPADQPDVTGVGGTSLTSIVSSRLDRDGVERRCRCRRGWGVEGLRRTAVAADPRGRGTPRPSTPADPRRPSSAAKCPTWRPRPTPTTATSSSSTASGSASAVPAPQHPCGRHSPRWPIRGAPRRPDFSISGSTPPGPDRRRRSTTSPSATTTCSIRRRRRPTTRPPPTTTWRRAGGRPGRWPCWVCSRDRAPAVRRSPGSTPRRARPPGGGAWSSSGSGFGTGVPTVRFGTHPGEGHRPHPHLGDRGHARCPVGRQAGRHRDHRRPGRRDQRGGAGLRVHVHLARGRGGGPRQGTDSRRRAGHRVRDALLRAPPR